MGLHEAIFSFRRVDCLIQEMQLQLDQGFLNDMLDFFAGSVAVPDEVRKPSSPFFPLFLFTSTHSYILELKVVQDSSHSFPRLVVHKTIDNTFFFLIDNNIPLQVLCQHVSRGLPLFCLPSNGAHFMTLSPCLNLNLNIFSAAVS